MALTLNGTTGLSGIVGSAATPALQGSDTNTGYFFGTDTLGLSTGGSQRLTIDSSGNVGIASTPTARLDVRRSDTDGKIAEFHQSTGYGIDIGSSTSDAYISSGYNQKFHLKTDAAGGAGQETRLTIDQNGVLLVGATAVTNASIAEFSKSVNAGAAGCHITVENTSTDSVNNTAGIHLKTDQGVAKFFAYRASETYVQSRAGGTSDLLLYADGASKMRLYTNGKERLQIDSSGNLTAVNAEAGGQSVTLSVGASNVSGTNDGIIKIINGGLGNGVIQWDYETNLNRAQIYVYRSTQELIFTVAGNERARITDDGIKLPAGKGINFDATGDAPISPSSEILDDYEEGTWAPTLHDASGNNSTFGTVTNANYTRIGNTVRLSMRAVNMSTTGMVSGNAVYVKGLPYNTSQYNYGTAWIRSFNDSVWGPDACLVFAICDTNQIFFQGDNGANAGAIFTWADVNHNSTDCWFTIVYKV